MPWNGSGAFVLTEDFSTARDLGPPDSLIDADDMDSVLNDIASGLENCLTRNGENEASANIPMGGFTFTGLAEATSLDQPLRASQASRGQVDWIGTFGGTANSLTATLPFDPSPLISGIRVRGIVASDNTGAVTLALNGAAPKDIRRADGTALTPKDLRAGRIVTLEYNGTYFMLASALFQAGRGAGLWNLTSPTVSGGTAYAATVDSSWVDYSAGQMFNFVCPGNNSGAATLALNGGSAKALVAVDGSALSANALANGSIYLLQYDGTSLRVVNAGTLPLTVSGTLDSISDVDSPSPAVGDVLVRNAANTAWVNSAGLTNLATLTGRALTDTHLGTFTGSTIADNVSIKTALQSLETAVESLTAENIVNSIQANSAAHDDLKDGLFAALEATDAAAMVNAIQASASAHDDLKDGIFAALEATDSSAMVSSINANAAALEALKDALIADLDAADTTAIVNAIQSNSAAHDDLKDGIFAALEATDSSAMVSSINANATALESLKDAIVADLDAADTSTIVDAIQANSAAHDDLKDGIFAALEATDARAMVNAIEADSGSGGALLDLQDALTVPIVSDDASVIGRKISPSFASNTQTEWIIDCGTDQFGAWRMWHYGGGSHTSWYVQVSEDGGTTWPSGTLAASTSGNGTAMVCVNDSTAGYTIFHTITAVGGGVVGYSGGTAYTISAAPSPSRKIRLTRNGGGNILFNKLYIERII